MQLLAAVLTLVSVRIELTAKVMRAVPECEIRHLMHNARPSENWRVWIARHVGTDLKDTRIATPQCKSFQSQPRRVVLNIAIRRLQRSWSGQLYAHVFFSTVWPNFEGYESVGLTRIWPANELHISTEYLPAMSEQEGVALHATIARMGKSGVL